MKSMKLSCCPTEKEACVRWIDKYFKDCLRNLNDEVSFGFGILSLICWGIAEIPQIVTNFKNKSGHGVSLAFLSTWVIGDIFNLVGCILEPATLPTQYYTALLYTTTTIVLVLQCVYYDHFLQWSKCRQFEANQIMDGTLTKPSNPRPVNPSVVPQSAPVNVPGRRDFCYMSARSLARSDTSPMQFSYIKAKSGPSALEHETRSSSEDEQTPVSCRRPRSKPRSIPRSVGYGTFLAASLNLPHGGKALMVAYEKISGRRLLHEHKFSENVSGQWLGWAMAAIYMGGRIPQIWLNIKRGNVEGLNPLMFVFALIANATYVGSIVMRSTEWEKIKANLPWLLDAIVCVALDLFIILQYIYYSHIMNKKLHCTGEYYGDYVEANKTIVS